MRGIFYESIIMIDMYVKEWTGTKNISRQMLVRAPYFKLHVLNTMYFK